MRPPRLLVCGFDSFPEAPRNPSAATIQALEAAGWTPPAAEVSWLTLPVAWRRSVETVLDHAADGRFDGVLVVGVAVGEDAFRIETLGRNRAEQGRPDHDGEVWPAMVIDDGAPAELAATAPCEAMLEALVATGLPARASDDAGGYLCNFTLFRLLAEPAIPAAGFLHVPQARECAEEATLSLADIEAAVRACVSTFAEALAAGLRDPAEARRTA